MATKPAAKPTAKNKPAATTASSTAKPVAAKPATATPAAKPAVAKPAATKSPATKTAAKPAVKAAAKPVAKTAAPAVKKTASAPQKAASKAAVANDKAKTPKVKMERDSFTMPKDEYAQIAALKKRLEGLGKPVKKSELLRAGLKLLSTLNDTALKAALGSVPTIKTGRPKK
ncbi:hypothetical protein ACFQ2T_13105 [Methylophilus flavus]|uniref:Uncharacterized protein n=1 Tax=Methylophilus flavus TaxID=640084 RepID=A0ABW3PIX7_9PROT